jgi:CheY-like chemotaxis protein/anti-sigma regulatory factor (Ser/Thr protein kinase)
MSGTAPISVLVVDDDADTRFLLRRAFERDGRLQVVGEVTDGALAAAAARVHEPDLVLLDLTMREMGGLAALPEVQAATPSTTMVVLMSVNPPPEEELDAAGAAFVRKSPGLDGFVGRLLELVAVPDGEDSTTADAVTWHLPANPRSGGVARRHLRDLLEEWHLEDLRHEVELLATELINNAVLHADSEVTLAVKRRGDVLHVAVSDTGEGTPQQTDAGLEATHGRGLMLVQALSHDWGAAVNGEHKTLWFELSLPA